jgi:thioredoxin 1
MTFKSPLIIALLVAVCTCGPVSPRKRPESISSASAARWTQGESKPVILDVRTENEYNEGHIAGAKWISWTSREFDNRVTSELDPSQPVLVYCRSGKRSAAASEKLVSLGFSDVRNLKGGVLSWQNESLPLTR